MAFDLFDMASKNTITTDLHSALRLKKHMTYILVDTANTFLRARHDLRRNRT